jgi:hypothetical protein
VPKERGHDSKEVKHEKDQTRVTIIPDGVNATQTGRKHEKMPETRVKSVKPGRKRLKTEEAHDSEDRVKMTRNKVNTAQTRVNPENYRTQGCPCVKKKRMRQSNCGSNESKYKERLKERVYSSNESKHEIMNKHTG